MGEWLDKVTDITWAFIKAYCYWLRSPLKYRIVSESSITFWRDDNAVVEEITFIGVVQDIPDVTPHSIIHKWAVVKTFYGRWKADEHNS